MENLISGKEALIALANGDEVEMVDSDVPMDWTEICVKAGDFFGKVEPCPWMFVNTPEHIKFRLKPSTIKIGDIEVPAPFEPESGDECFYLCDEGLNGYKHVKELQVDDWGFQLGTWRTEDEIKQVVAALRKLMGF